LGRPNEPFQASAFPGEAWEGGTKDEMRISKEALFKGVSTQFGPLTIEESIENPHFIFCSFFPTLLLGSINYSEM
jgi:hypothetical protein